MKRVLVLSLAALSVSFSLFAADAPSAPKPQMFLIHEEVARPSMLPQYESTTRELLGLLTEKKADPKQWGMDNFMTDDLHYFFVVPISNFGSIDGFQGMWKTMSESVGKAKWDDLMRRGNSAMSSYDEFVVMHRPDLSYMPASPRLKQDEQRFYRWEFYYLDAARAEEAEQVAKDFIALFRSKNVPDGFNVYTAMSGHDMPLLVVTVGAKSAADFYASNERIESMLGNDLRALGARAMSITRKFETRNVMLRPDLSYPVGMGTIGMMAAAAK